MFDTVRDIGIDVLTTALLAIGAVGIPWGANKVRQWTGYKLSAANQAKLRGFVRAGIHVAANEAKRRLDGDKRMDPVDIEKLAIDKAKAAAKKAGSKLLDKLSENDIVDTVRTHYEEMKAEKANVKNLATIVDTLEATIKRIDDAPTPHEILSGKVKMKQLDNGDWVRAD